jgi:GAF domain-containing protein
MSGRPAERRSTERRATAAFPPDGVDRRAAERRSRERRTAGHRLEVILDVTRRLMSVTDLDSLLHLMAEATQELLAADRATIFIVDADRGELWSRVALGAGEIRIPLGTGIAGSVAQTGDVINIPDAYADPRFNPEPDQQSGYQTKSLLTYPMTGQEGRVIGVFQAVNKHGGGGFTTADEDTLASLAASAAVAVENAQLVAEQKQLWQTLIETLAMTVDARDQQTAGHSQRVTRYADVIGRAMGLRGKDLEKLRAAALLHDYGKIAVRDRFLQKPGKLDDAEFEYVPVIASQHHERMDGKGYPKGLAAESIVLGARIVAAADVFDALTAPRYYKPAYPLDRTLEIMDGMSGDHLDPKVMAAVHTARPHLEAALAALKHTWPKPGDEGMGTIQEAAGLSERDRAAQKAAST